MFNIDVPCGSEIRVTKVALAINTMKSVIAALPGKRGSLGDFNLILGDSHAICEGEDKQRRAKPHGAGVR